MLDSAILKAGNVAVITGGASGIGLAAAHNFAHRGMSLFLVDRAADALDAALEALRGVQGVGQVEGMVLDVGKIDEVVGMREKVLDVFGEVHVLMNNAGTSKPCPAFSLTETLEQVQEKWHAVIDTNLWGIVNVAQAFAPYMARQENSSVVICTGSKQGITCPPGNAGYNCSKSAVKTFTEQLAHELRNAPDSRCTAHLFVPGWVHTGLTGAGSGKPKPSGAWTPEQTVEYMLEHVFDLNQFYIVCPDNETSSLLDKARMEWAMGDVLQGRPALSRWHPQYAARFQEFINAKQGLSARSRSRGRPPLREGEQS